MLRNATYSKRFHTTDGELVRFHIHALQRRRTEEEVIKRQKTLARVPAIGLDCTMAPLCRLYIDSLLEAQQHPQPDDWRHFPSFLGIH